MLFFKLITYICSTYAFLVQAKSISPLFRTITLLAVKYRSVLSD